MTRERVQAKWVTRGPLDAPGGALRIQRWRGNPAEEMTDVLLHVYEHDADERAPGSSKKGTGRDDPLVTFQLTVRVEGSGRAQTVTITKAEEAATVPDDWKLPDALASLDPVLDYTVELGDEVEVQVPIRTPPEELEALAGSYFGVEGSTFELRFKLRRIGEKQDLFSGQRSHVVLVPRDEVTYPDGTFERMRAHYERLWQTGVKTSKSAFEARKKAVRALARIGFSRAELGGKLRDGKAVPLSRMFFLKGVRNTRVPPVRRRFTKVAQGKILRFRGNFFSPDKIETHAAWELIESWCVAAGYNNSQLKDKESFQYCGVTAAQLYLAAGFKPEHMSNINQGFGSTERIVYTARYESGAFNTEWGVALNAEDAAPPYRAALCQPKQPIRKIVPISEYHRANGARRFHLQLSDGSLFEDRFIPAPKDATEKGRYDSQQMRIQDLEDLFKDQALPGTLLIVGKKHDAPYGGHVTVVESVCDGACKKCKRTHSGSYYDATLAKSKANVVEARQLEPDPYPGRLYVHTMEGNFGRGLVWDPVLGRELLEDDPKLWTVAKCKTCSPADKGRVTRDCLNCKQAGCSVCKAGLRETWCPECYGLRARVEGNRRFGHFYPVVLQLVRERLIALGAQKRIATWVQAQSVAEEERAHRAFAEEAKLVRLLCSAVLTATNPNVRTPGVTRQRRKVFFHRQGKHFKWASIYLARLSTCDMEDLPLVPLETKLGTTYARQPKIEKARADQAIADALLEELYTDPTAP